MFVNAEHNRYKQKLERLHAKVRKSEGARKELETKFKKLMKERNECEKAASVHKSKYDFMLEQEQKRMQRNRELLRMLEDIDTKATALATRTERLKMLKTQQERALMASWRYSMQQMMFNGGVPIQIVPTSGQSSIVYGNTTIRVPTESMDSNRFIDAQQQPNVPIIEINNGQLLANDPHTNNQNNTQILNPIEIQSQLNHTYRNEPISILASNVVHANPNFSNHFAQQQLILPTPIQSNRFEQQHQQQQQQRQKYPEQKSAEVFVNNSSEIHFAIDDYRNRMPTENYLNPIEISNRTNQVENKSNIMPSLMANPIQIISNEMKLFSQQHLNNPMVRGIDNDKNEIRDVRTYSYNMNTNANANENQRPTVHYQNQRNQFSSISDQPLHNAAYTLSPVPSNQPQSLPYPTVVPFTQASTSPEPVANRYASRIPNRINDANASNTTCTLDDMSKRFSNDFRLQSSQNNDDIHDVNELMSPVRSQQTHVRDNNDNSHQAHDFFNSLSNEMRKQNSYDGNDVSQTSTNDKIFERDLHLQPISQSPMTISSPSSLGRQIEQNSLTRNEKNHVTIPPPQRPIQATVTTFPRFETMRLAIENDKRRPSADIISTVSKTLDDDLPKQTEKMNLCRRYSVASNIHDLLLPTNNSSIDFLSNSVSRPISPISSMTTAKNVNFYADNVTNSPISGKVNHINNSEQHLNVRLTSNDGNDWYAMETPITTTSWYPDDHIENAKDFSSEKNQLSFNENPHQYEAALSGGTEMLQQTESNSIEQQMEKMRFDDDDDDDDRRTEDQLSTDSIAPIHHTSNPIEKAPIHSKTVKWADDPEYNYKKEMTTSVAELSVKPIEVPEVKQYQNENTGNEENQYSNIAQGFEELHSSNQPNSNYYYGDDGSYQQIDSEQNQPYYTQDSQVYQDQYYYENGNNQTATVVEQQQYQQMEPNHLYYEENTQFTNDIDETQPQQTQYSTNEYTTYPDQTTDGGNTHESYYDQNDFNYYTNEPGENYYAENEMTTDRESESTTTVAQPYTNVDYDYTNESNQFTNVPGNSISNVTGEMTLSYQSQLMQSPADVTTNATELEAYDDGQMNGTAYVEPTPTMRQKIPNYLQSDTEESSQSIAIGPPRTAAATKTMKKRNEKIKKSTNAPPNVQSHDSDFDF